jgi:hypothetical protein
MTASHTTGRIELRSKAMTLDIDPSALEHAIRLGRVDKPIDVIIAN